MLFKAFPCLILAELFVMFYRFSTGVTDEKPPIIIVGESVSNFETRKDNL
jgi:hypothetical protein